MKYSLQFTAKAKGDFLCFKKDVQKRISTKLRFYLSSDDPLQYAKKLKDKRLGMYRFRIWDYRAIFDIDKRGEITILIILRVKHRRESYL